MLCKYHLGQKKKFKKNLLRSFKAYKVMNKPNLTYYFLDNYFITNGARVI